LKRFRDGEAVVLCLEEGVVNNNEVKRTPLGYSERSNHQANKLKSGKVGTIIGKDLKTQETLLISPGKMTHSEREYYWDNPQALIDKIIKYKTFDYGALNTPRFSTYQAFRSAEDM
jgi:DNA ligase-1